MLRSLTKEADDEIVVEEPPEITQAIFDAKKAVYHSAEFVPPKGKEKKNDRDPTLKYDDEVSDTALEKFTIIGKDAKNLLTHSLHLGLVTDVCGYLTVVDLFVGLDADLCRAVQLAKAYRPDIPFDPKHSKVLIFLEDIVFPAVRSDGHRQDALDVAEDVKIALTSHSDDDSKILDAFGWAESRTVSGSSKQRSFEDDDDCDEDESTYCAGIGSKFDYLL